MFRLFTFNSDQLGAARFFRRALLFLAVPLAVALTYEAAIFRTGESWPISRVVRVQDGLEDFLYSRGLFSQQFNVYKYQMIKRRNPGIVILGTSRVMQIRDFFFHPFEKEVYNAGGMTRNIHDIAAYVGYVESGDLPTPKVVIVGIDPWWFKPGWGRDDSWLEGAQFKDEAFQFSAHASVAQRLIKSGGFPWRAVKTGAPGPSPYYRIAAIGAHALENGVGFRPDGSRLYAPTMFIEFMKDGKYIDRMVPPIPDRIRNNTHEWSLPMVIDGERVVAFVDPLLRLKNMGIEVLTFIPPFSDESVKALEQSQSASDWWADVQIDLPNALYERGVFCMPPSHPSANGLNDTYMIDGWHPGEVYAAYVIRDLVHRAPDESLLKSVDLKEIDKKIHAKRTIPLSFDPPPTMP